MKKTRKKFARHWGEAATTTNKDWGFKPVPGKGGKTLNGDIPEGAFYKQMKVNKHA